jgi:hypothetical protein
VQAQALSFAENYISCKFFGKSNNIQVKSRVLVATAEVRDSDVVDISNMIMLLSLLLNLELDLIGNI